MVNYLTINSAETVFENSRTSVKMNNAEKNCSYQLQKPDESPLKDMDSNGNAGDEQRLSSSDNYTDGSGLLCGEHVDPNSGTIAEPLITHLISHVLRAYSDCDQYGKSGFVHELNACSTGESQNLEFYKELILERHSYSENGAQIHELGDNLSFQWNEMNKHGIENRETTRKLLECLEQSLRASSSSFDEKQDFSFQRQKFPGHDDEFGTWRVKERIDTTSLSVEAIALLDFSSGIQQLGAVEDKWKFPNFMITLMYSVSDKDKGHLRITSEYDEVDKIAYMTCEIAETHSKEKVVSQPYESYANVETNSQTVGLWDDCQLEISFLNIMLSYFAHTVEDERFLLIENLEDDAKQCYFINAFMEEKSNLYDNLIQIFSSSCSSSSSTGSGNESERGQE